MIKTKTDLETTSRRIRLIAILFSLVGGILILVIKFYAAVLTNSSALRSDALEGTVNVLAAAFGLGSIIFAEKPADRDHPYGHGKIEYFSSAFEGGLISLAGFLILVDTVIRFLHHQVPSDLGFGLKLSVFSGMMNGVMGILIYRVGKKHQSQVLVADGIHLLSDLVTTVALTIGLLVVYFTHIYWIDPMLAIGIAIFLFKTGYSLVDTSAKALLDAENPDILQSIVDQMNFLPRGEVITAHGLKAQQFGRDTHVDLHVVVPEYITIKEAHAEADLIAGTLRDRLGHNSVVHTHIDPCERDFCEECPVEDCPIRANGFHQIKPFTLESLTDPGKH
jgi:cation diffusion facilitator family transporter